MKRLVACLQGFLIIILFAAISSCSQRSGKPRVLVFSKTAGFHHESIPDGIAAIQKLGSQHNFEVDTTSNAEWFREDSLKNYAAVIFMSTTGDVLNHYQEVELERYIQAGGGYAGIHAAADTEYDWGWYGRLVGGYFLTHPGIQDSFPNVQPGTLQVVDKDHISTKDLPAEWKRTDEFYSFKKMDSTVNVLLKIDEGSFKGGYMDGNHPMAWYHEYDGGRAWYTNLGHTKETFSEELFLKHLLGGIQYAMGDNRELDYEKAKTASVPEENRFAKTGLVNGQLFEPTEMTILPNEDILIAQRRGEIMLYKKGDSVLKQAGFLNVYWKTNTPGVNAEEGVLGLQKDPQFAKNNYVFIYYSPIDSSVNRLSRFKFANDKIDMQSEKVVLEVKSDREICCHTGGSIAFGKDGLLYLSTGDNTTPFDEPKQPHPNGGYAPLDDRPGHAQYDARRSSGNSNDLRGKVLRIRVKDDGTYEIPDGNLFADVKAGRPEIYTMGHRNPYRISVDQKNNFLYWGEVGPDAARDSAGVRGPRGYDEVNQARKAGFFGWPLFIGNNYAYKEFDFETGKPGQNFDPAKPMNVSRNNTGTQNLPPTQPAFIWYPYDASIDFPQLGTGGRNAMVGPVYYTDLFPKETRLPDYYNGKLLIYDWMRGWIKAVTLKPNGDFDKMEPFMPGTKLNNCIDMEVGPDGRLYLLEYGSGWFSKNADAGLFRIDYNGGNRAPVIAGINVDKTSGALPFKVIAKVEAKDLENDALTYQWQLGNGVTKETKVPQLEHTFSTAGDYTIAVVVKDDKNAAAKSSPVSVYAGNEAPVVNITLEGNKTFYFPGKAVAYTVNVTDKDDASVTNDVANVFISADYVEGLDKAGASMGHQVQTEAMAGRSMVLSLDCKACHKVTEKSIGPAYTAVSQRYQKNPNATTHLVTKIIKGGAGVWGDVAMPAHPDLKEGDARQVVSWIMSLSNTTAKQKSLPAKGTINPTLDKKLAENGVLVLSASYTDKGGATIKPMMGHTSVALRNPNVTMDAARNLNGYTTMSYGGRVLMMVPKDKASFSLDSIDLTGIGTVELALAGSGAPKFGYVFELRLDGPNGKKVGEGKLMPNANFVKGAGGFGMMGVTVSIAPVGDGKLHNLYLVSQALNAGEAGTLIITAAQFKAGRAQNDIVKN